MESWGVWVLVLVLVFDVGEDGKGGRESEGREGEGKWERRKATDLSSPNPWFLRRG
jgi:hypothetical protein